ncbi:hypothetical protein C8Q74DRAFT_592441 [Fomes fomentarius]|nr:hypothetical protein C8Q74DRAFT_592441 [Fomes fomentarius]
MAVTSRASLIVADVLVLIITWRSTHKNSRTQGFAGVLLRDGLLYFFAQLLLNVFYFITLFVVGTSFISVGITSLAEIFVDPLTSILVSRFLMNLQETDIHTQHRHGISSMSSIHMSRVIGSIGVELNAPGPVEDIQSEDRVQTDSVGESVSV